MSAFSIADQRKREILERRLAAHEELEFELESNIRTLEKMKRLDQIERAQSELAQQRLAIESVKEQLEQVS